MSDDVAFRNALPTGARLRPRGFARNGVIVDPASPEAVSGCWERRVGLSAAILAVILRVIGALGGSEHGHSASGHHRHGNQGRYQEEYHPPPRSLHNHHACSSFRRGAGLINLTLLST